MLPVGRSDSGGLGDPAPSAVSVLSFRHSTGNTAAGAYCFLMRRFHRSVLLVAIVSSQAAFAAESDPAVSAGGSADPQAAIKRFRAAPGLKVDLVAAEPLLQNVVSFSFDKSGRIYVVETHRRRTSVFDIRNFPDWLDADYGLRSVAERAEFYRQEVSDQNPSFMAVVGKSKRGGFGDFNKDGKITSADLEVESERVRLLTDKDGDGRYDEAVTFADGFNTSVSGVAAGVLVHGTNVWFTSIPDVWRFGLPSSTYTPTAPLMVNAPGSKSPVTSGKVASGFGVHIAFGGHDMHGLKLGPDGRLYWSIADRGTTWRTNFSSRFFPGETLKNLIPDTGAIFRSEPDGSNIEVVAVGLRNPQELAFDDQGNLWTGDNNADGGDKARWVYVRPGSDSGWRIGWQWQNSPKLGAWNAEGLWWNTETNTAAYILPPVGHVGRGPSGVAWYPGTGMPAKYDGHFLMCDFPDGVRSFAVKPRGAGFSVTDDQQFLWGIFATDVDFGPGGGAFVSDWVEGWEKTGKGRIYRVADEATLKEPLVVETRRLLAEDFAKKSTKDLTQLLSHRDQRVRLEAQWTLAGQELAGVTGFHSALAKSSPQLARLHGVWGLGQIARTGTKGREAAKKLLPPFLADDDGEVRGQTAKLLGELRETGAAPKILSLLKDPSPRVRSLAAIALGQIGSSEATPALLTALRENNDRDGWLRHALVMGLVGTAKPAQIEALAKDDSEAVRIATVLTLRRWQHPALGLFLDDSSLRVRAEAARAIYDQGLKDLYLVLAKVSARDGVFLKRSFDREESVLRDAIELRVANALFRRGTAADVSALADLAKSSASAAIRAEAVTLLGNWPNPPKRDRVTGLFDPAPARPAAVAAEALKAVLPALKALPASKEFVELLAKAERNLGLVQTTAAPSTLAGLKGWLDSGKLSDQRTALALLAKRPDAEPLLKPFVEKLAAGQLAPELAADVWDAAATGSSTMLKAQLEAFVGKLDSSDKLAAFRSTLAPGDALNGRRIFNEKQELGCQRCHSIQKGDGGEVGPLLSGVGTRQTREYLLESIVRPNAKVAAGFEQVIVEMKNGQTYAGIIKSDKPDVVELLSAEDGVVKLKAADIKSRERGPSSMPEGLGDLMTRRELRDLIEFLGALK